MKFLLLLTSFLLVQAAASANESLPAAIIRTARPMSLEGGEQDWQALQAEQTLLGPWGVAATFKAAFDDDNFYARFSVRDDSPLRNQSQAIEELIKGGDALSLCFGALGKQTHPQRIVLAQVNDRPVVVAMRPHWSAKKPYTYRSVGSVDMDQVAPLEGAALHFDKSTDGYVARVRLPWKALALQPQPEKTLPFDAQVIFSDPAGSLNVGTVWWQCKAAGALATTDLVTEAKLYSKDWGNAQFYERDPGKRPAPLPPDDDDQTLAFLGPGTPITFELERPSHVSLILRNADGWIVRELLRAKKLPAGRHTVYFDGRDRTGMPLPLGEYNYRLGIFDGLQNIPRGTLGNSGRPPWRTDDGLGSIGGVHGGPTSVHAGKHGLYMLCSGEEGQRCLRLIDPDTGKARWYASIGVFAGGFGIVEHGEHAFLLHRRGKQTRLTRLNAETGATVPYGKEPSLLIDLPNSRGLAIVGDHAYLGDVDNNRLLKVDLKTGELGEPIAVTSPQGLYSFDEHSLLLCSQDQLLRIEVPSGKQHVIAKGLDKPRAVTRDAQGTIYVSEWGKSQQIQRFDAAGKKLTAWGVPGGRSRTVLSYNPAQLNDVRSLAVDAKGRLWGAEAAHLRRFFCLGPDGKWLEDYYGPVGYVSVGADLDDLTTVYHQANSHGPDLIENKMDYAAFAAQPEQPHRAFQIKALHCLSQNGVDDTASPDLMTPTAKAGYGRILVFRAENGRRYLFKASRKSFALWVERDGRWCSVAARCERREMGQPTEFWHWSDTNGDALVQEQEVTRETDSRTAWVGISRNLTIHGADFDWPAASINEHGAPVYQTKDLRSTFADNTSPLTRLFDQSSYTPQHSPPGSDGARYHASNVGAEAGLSFWDRASELRLCRFVNGKLDWVVGHHNGRYRYNGDSLMVMNMGGEIDGVVLATEVGANFLAYTTDGLSLGWLNVGPNGKAREAGPTAWYVENVQPGLWVKDPKSGKRLLIAASTEDVRITEIDGVFGSQVRRLDGKVTLKQVRPRAKDNTAAIPYLTFQRTQGPRYLGVDGVDTEWRADQPAIEIREQQQLAAEVRLRRDAGMLYVFADILAPQSSGVVAAQAVDKQLPTLQVMLGSAEPANRKELITGDTMFNIEVRDTGRKIEGVVMIRRSGASPLPASEELRPLGKQGNFTGDPPKKRLDCAADFVRLPGAEAVIKPRLDQLGWRLEASIPLAALPELTVRRTVQFERLGRYKGSAERNDLNGNLRLGLLLTRPSAAGEQRLGWPKAIAENAVTSLPVPAQWGPVQVSAP